MYSFWFCILVKSGNCEGGGQLHFIDCVQSRWGANVDFPFFHPPFVLNSYFTSQDIPHKKLKSRFLCLSPKRHASQIAISDYGKGRCGRGEYYFWDVALLYFFSFYFIRFLIHYFASQCIFFPLPDIAPFLLIK